MAESQESRLVELNIGGERFVTIRRDTLTQVGAIAGLLAAEHENQSRNSKNFHHSGGGLDAQCIAQREA